MITDRIKALSDGVLAIVLTILVLGFEVPDHVFSREGLLSFLVKLKEPLIAYVVSFGIVAVYWVQHASIFNYVRIGNRIFVWLNFLFLLPLTLIPFTTNMRAMYHHEYAITGLYSGLNVLCGVMLLTLWRYAVARGLTTSAAAQVDTTVRRWIRLGVWINLAAAAVAPLSTYLSSVIFLMLPAIYIYHSALDDVLFETDASG